MSRDAKRVMAATNGTPTRREIQEYLSTLLVEIGKIPVDHIVAGARVDAELRMESVAFIELQVALEDHFDVEIDPLEVLELNELEAIIDYLCDRIATRARVAPRT